MPWVAWAGASWPTTPWKICRCLHPWGKTKGGRHDFNKPRMRQVAEAVLAMSTSPTSPAGFTASNLAQKVRKLSGQAEADYGPRRAAYDIKKLRAKGMLRKIGSEPHVVTSPCERVCEQSPRCRSSVTKSSDPCSPPANGLSRRPNPTIQHRSNTITDHLRAGRNLLTALGVVA